MIAKIKTTDRQPIKKNAIYFLVIATDKRVTIEKVKCVMPNLLPPTWEKFVQVKNTEDNSKAQLWNPIYQKTWRENRKWLYRDKKKAVKIR